MEKLTSRYRAAAASALTRLFFAWAFAFSVCALSFDLHAQAASFTDDMETAFSDDVRTVQGLAPRVVGGGGIWSGLYDKTFLSFSTATPSGRVIYRLENCQSITVGIYTNMGAFVHRQEDRYAMGITEPGSSTSRRPAGTVRPLYSPSRQAVYHRVDGALRGVAYDDFYVFDPPELTGTPPPVNPGDLIPYAVNVYASADGVKYGAVSLQAGFLDYTAGSSYCYEEFTASIPASARFVMVEINDFIRYYDYFTGSMESKQRNLMTGLAMVELTGTALIMGTGPPESGSSPGDSGSSGSGATSTPESSGSSAGSGGPIESGAVGSGSSSNPSSSSKSSSSSKASSSSQSSAKSSAQKTGGKNPDDEEETASRSSSKFEGVIVSSQSSRSSGSAPSASRKQSQVSSKFEASPFSQEEDTFLEKQIASQALSEEDAEAGPPEVSLYKTPVSEDSDSRFTKGIVAYIAVICGVILFIFLRAGKKQP